MEQSTIAADSSPTATEPEQLTETIVNAVADEKGVDPVDLDPLYNVIDPDALNSLFHSRPRVNSVASTGTVQFTYHGFQVQVSAGGDVTLEEPTDAIVGNAD